MSDLDATLAAPSIVPGPPAFHLLAKPTGATCNLDCAYCFFLSKEMLYPGSRFRMADELLEQYVRQLIEAHRIPHVTIAWQGGEPTMMGVDFFRRATAYVEKHRRPGMTVEYTIQTNGTLIDDELAAFLKEHDYLVGISIDGPPAMHDAYRVDRGGAPTFERVRRGLERLQAHGVEYNTLTTLHRANADHPVEVYRFLRDECGARFMQFIPIIERLPAPRIDVPLAELGLAPGVAQTAPWTSWRDRPLYRQEGSLVTDRSVTAEQYGSFLVGVFEEWVRRDIGEVYVQMFDVALASWYGEPPTLCIHSETCGTALALEHNGDLYSCDHFVEEKHRLGNITETPMIELVASEQQRAFGLAKRDTLPRYCRECDVRFACHGGCPKDRFIETPDWRARAQLPVRRLQGVLRPRRPADAADVRPPSPGSRAGRADGLGRRRGRADGGGRREGRPQRPLPLRQRAQGEALPRPARRRRTCSATAPLTVGRSPHRAP